MASATNQSLAANSGYLRRLLFLAAIPIVLLLLFQPALEKEFILGPTLRNLNNLNELPMYGIGSDLPKVVFPAQYLERESDLRQCCGWFLEWHNVIVIGRPLQALLTDFYFVWMDSIADLSLGRLASGAIMAWVGMVLFHIFHRSILIPAGTAVAGALAVVTTSAIQMSVITVNQAVANVLTMLLAMLTYLALNRIDRRDLLLVNHRLVFFGLLALLLGLLAMNCYPPAALLLMVPAMARLLNAERNDWLNQRYFLLRDAVFAILLGALYFLTARFITIPLGFFLMPEMVQMVRATYSLSITPSLMEILSRMATAYHIALSSWSSPSLWAVWGSLGVVTLGAAATIWRLVTETHPITGRTAPVYRFLLEKAFFLFAILGLALAPNLIAKNNPHVILGLRDQVVSHAMIALLVVFALGALVRALPVPNALRVRTGGAALALLIGALVLNGRYHTGATADFFSHQLEQIRSQTHQIIAQGKPTLFYVIWGEDHAAMDHDGSACFVEADGDLACMYPKEISSYAQGQNMSRAPTYWAFQLIDTLKQADYAHPVRILFGDRAQYQALIQGGETVGLLDVPQWTDSAIPEGILLSPPEGHSSHLENGWSASGERG